MKYGLPCESASNLDSTPIEHQIVEAEAELFISGVFDRRPTGTLLFSRNSFNCNGLQRFRQGSKLDADSHPAGCPAWARCRQPSRWDWDARLVGNGLAIDGLVGERRCVLGENMHPRLESAVG